MADSIRKITQKDIAGLKEVLDSTGLFPSAYLVDMISDYLNNPKTQDIWFTKIIDNKNVGLGYCAPEKLTEGTYNLYVIAVRKELQGQGIGQQMMAYIEKLLKEKSKKLLIVETSSDDQFTPTRQFYEKIGYQHEATIRDFWKDGDDKIIYWKKLN